MHEDMCMAADTYNPTKQNAEHALAMTFLIKILKPQCAVDAHPDKSVGWPISIAIPAESMPSFRKISPTCKQKQTRKHRHKRAHTQHEPQARPVDQWSSVAYNPHRQMQ